MHGIFGSACDGIVHCSSLMSTVRMDNEVSEERKEGRKRQGAARFQPWAGRPCYSTMAGCRAVKAYDVAGRWSTSASPNPEIPLIRPALNVKR